MHYLIDVSRPRGQRIRDLTYRGKPVRADQTFIVATNSYRANGGGHFPGLDGHATVLAAPDANRAILVALDPRAIRASPAPTAAGAFLALRRLKTRGPVDRSRRRRTCSDQAHARRAWHGLRAPACRRRRHASPTAVHPGALTASSRTG